MRPLIRIMPILAVFAIACATLSIAAKPQDKSKPIPGQLRNLGELPIGDMPPGALNPQFGRVTGAAGLDFVVGYNVPFTRGHKDKRGRLRVYPNVGTATRPRYEKGFWLDDRIPSARIPSG